MAGSWAGVVDNALNPALGHLLRSALHGTGSRVSPSQPVAHDAPPRTKGSVMATTLVVAHAFKHLYAHSIPIIILAITTECELGALSVGAVVVILSIFGGITSTAGGFLVPDRIISHPSCHDTNLGECSCNLRSSSDSGSKHPASLSTPRPRRSWTKQQARCTPSSESTLTTPCVAGNVHLLYGRTSMLFG